MSHRPLVYQETLMDFFVSASPDQTVTANKDKEQHGNRTQKDLAVIAGLSFPPLCCFIFLWLIENDSQLFILCICLHLHSFFFPPGLLITPSQLKIISITATYTALFGIKFDDDYFQGSVCAFKTGSICFALCFSLTRTRLYF